MAKLSETNVNGVHHNIEFFGGGDWKFLALNIMLAFGGSVQKPTNGMQVNNGLSQEQ